MAARKTVSIETLKTGVNEMILNTPDEDKSGRELLGLFLESMLMETKNYRGFRYLTEKDMRNSQNGVSVGIKYYVDPFGDPARQFDGTDNSRVHYF